MAIPSAMQIRADGTAIKSSSLRRLFPSSGSPFPPAPTQCCRRCCATQLKCSRVRCAHLALPINAFHNASLQFKQSVTSHCRFEVARGKSPILIKCKAVDSEADDKVATYRFWDATTEQLSAYATFAFLLLQLPQIILNYKNLVAGNAVALAAVPWTGLLTGLLGNLSLLSYFAGKKERGATIVQAVGVISTFVVLIQLAIADCMPGPVFIATATAVIIGFTLNILNYNGLLSPGIWRVWQEIISIGGVSVLPQVMWTTFEPYVPASILPGTVFLVLATLMVILSRLERLGPKMSKFMGGVAAWSATLLFMWGPVAQMWTNFVNPVNIKGLSLLTILLAMTGNSLLLPRALFTRDLMWFTGSAWGALMQGWGILLSMYINDCVSGPIFLGISSVLVLWLGNMCMMDAKAYALASSFAPLAELIMGSRTS